MAVCPIRVLAKEEDIGCLQDRCEWYVKRRCAIREIVEKLDQLVMAIDRLRMFGGSETK